MLARNLLQEFDRPVHAPELEQQRAERQAEQRVRRQQPMGAFEPARSLVEVAVVPFALRSVPGSASQCFGSVPLGLGDADPVQARFCAGTLGGADGVTGDASAARSSAASATPASSAVCRALRARTGSTSPARPRAR